MQYFGLSNKGMVRGSNEDFFHVPENAEDKTFFIVADGMGGENAGEVASCLAVSSAAVYLNENFNKENDVAILLRKALNAANKVVYDTARSDKCYESMGTTMVCAVIKDNDVFVANVGDSRCYIVTENNLEQISIDHSYVQEMVDKGMLTVDEARKHPNKNLITRAVGIAKFVNVDVFMKNWKKGDKLLLASDGLTGMIRAEEISRIINENSDCKIAVNKLVQAANEAGGVDNITAVLISND